MKSLCLALTLCLTLTACGRTSAPQPSESPSASASAGSDIVVPAQPEDLTSPPELTVSTLYHVHSVTAVCGGFEWGRPEGGKSVIACGVGPLYEGMEWPLLYSAFGPGTLPPLEEGEFRSSIMPVYYLDFGAVPPTEVTARRWSADYIGQNDAYDKAEEVSVEWTEEHMSDIRFGAEEPVEIGPACYALYPLGDGEFVYEIHAVWEDYGSADYVFRTTPQVREG